MTTEAALTKLSYLLGKKLSIQEVKEVRRCGQKFCFKVASCPRSSSYAVEVFLLHVVQTRKGRA